MSGFRSKSARTHLAQGIAAAMKDLDLYHPDYFRKVTLSGEAVALLTQKANWSERDRGIFNRLVVEATLPEEASNPQPLQFLGKKRRSCNPKLKEIV